MRPRVIPTNNLVGKSERNGRVENTIRRVQEKFKASRHQVEQGIKEKIPDEAPIMFWLVRWAAEVISKYAPGDDGRTFFERIRREACAKPFAPFGEIVLYLKFQTAASNKGEPAKKQCIWLGTIERTEETFIGIARGVVKCRTLNKFSTDDMWDKDMVLGMQGVSWEPLFGKKIAHIPVEVNGNGHETDVGDETNKMFDNDDEGEEAGIKLRGGLDKLHTSRKAVNKYGPTKGCPACKEIERRGTTFG